MKRLCQIDMSPGFEPMSFGLFEFMDSMWTIPYQLHSKYKNDISNLYHNMLYIFFVVE